MWGLVRFGVARYGGKRGNKNELILGEGTMALRDGGVRLGTGGCGAQATTLNPTLVVRGRVRGRVAPRGEAFRRSAGR